MGKYTKIAMFWSHFKKKMAGDFIREGAFIRIHTVFIWWRFPCFQTISFSELFEKNTSFMWTHSLGLIHVVYFSQQAYFSSGIIE